MRCDRGYSVIELLIVLSLAVVILLGAAQLVAESVVIFERAGRAVRAPSLTLTMATIRRDIHDSAAVVGLPPVGWTQNPLELVSWDGRRTRFIHEGNDLVRQSYDLAGQPAGRRVLTRGVTSWWWRMSSPQTIDVRVIVTAAADPLGGRRGKVNRRTEQRRFSRRGSVDGRSW
jgi:prepilin-type N-terminal cleavage/methylation domain-containing protein